MADRIVQLGSFPDEASAWLARAEANGIPAVVAGANSSALHIMPTSVHLAVREQDVEEARRILQAMSDRPSA